MNRAVYQEMKNYDRVASWAVWDYRSFKDYKNRDKKAIENMEFIDSHLEYLKPNIVFVALNFMGDGKHDITALSCKGLVPARASWLNFHSPNPRSSDPGLREVLSNTRYEGAYLTDAIKNVSTIDGNDLMRKIKAGDVDMDQQAKIFTDELLALGEDSLEIYFMGMSQGKCSYYIYEEYSKKNPYFKKSLAEKIKLCTQTDHFGRANPYFPARFIEQLGIEYPRPMEAYLRQQESRG